MQSTNHHFTFQLILVISILLFFAACAEAPVQDGDNEPQTTPEMTGEDILGNPDYQAISFGGYRDTALSIQPTVAELKKDMKILAAMDIKVLRTYKTKYAHAGNVLKAIRQLKEADPNFEMYVMLGVWIDCANAWTDQPNHDGEDAEANAAEIQRAVDFANQYPDIVKVIAVGNEAMVKWAASYFVQPSVISKWVNYLQELKTAGKISRDLWITSSDNFASWGGGGAEYHTEDLNKLIKAVDYVSLHTYPMHDTHYNPQFWGITEEEGTLSDKEKIAAAMQRAQAYAINQYENTVNYIKSIDPTKPVHIGETGWASASNGFYGADGSKATDEYKEALYYQQIREWTNKNGISCFYFEAFDEPWKDAANPGGSENHFGLFTVDGQAKYVVWDLVEQGVFEGSTRGNNPIKKTYNGDLKALLQEVAIPPFQKESMVQ